MNSESFGRFNLSGESVTANPKMTALAQARISGVAVENKCANGVCEITWKPAPKASVVEVVNEAEGPAA